MMYGAKRIVKYLLGTDIVGRQIAVRYWEWIVNKGRQAGSTLGGDYVEVRYEDARE
jgi:hypothetical protein